MEVRGTHACALVGDYAGAVSEGTSQSAILNPFYIK